MNPNDKKFLLNDIWKEAEAEVIDELNERLKSRNNNHKETKKAIEVKEKWHQQDIKMH